MKKPRLSLVAFVGLMLVGLMTPVIAQVFQTGQLTLTGWPTLGRLPIDNGGPQFTNIRESAGTVTLNGATPVTVSNTNVTAGSVVIFTLKTVGGTVSPNAPNVLTITPGTGFTVGGTALDTSVYNWIVLG
jgi:hypothetical protein